VFGKGLIKQETSFKSKTDRESLVESVWGGRVRRSGITRNDCMSRRLICDLWSRQGTPVRFNAQFTCSKLNKLN